jgi:hypothetical protein
MAAIPQKDKDCDYRLMAKTRKTKSGFEVERFSKLIAKKLERSSKISLLIE